MSNTQNIQKAENFYEPTLKSVGLNQGRRQMLLPTALRASYGRR
ncbi:hypothetical protein [uncultured Nostoc sp.]